MRNKSNEPEALHEYISTFLKGILPKKVNYTVNMAC